MFRDGIFLFSTVEVLKWIQTYNVSTYMYLYDYVIDCKDGWGCYDPKFGKCLAIELRVFASLSRKSQIFLLDKAPITVTSV